MIYFEGFMHNCSNSIADAFVMELPQFKSLNQQF